MKDSDLHQGRPGAQPEECGRFVSAQQADRRYRRFGFGQIVAHHRHPLCRRAAPLRRKPFSAYVRQFLNRMDKPDVDYIRGLAPAIAIEQKVITRTPRSTVGSMTEIYDYLRLLFARIGRTISPVSGREVRKDDVGDVLTAIRAQKAGQQAVPAFRLPPAPQPRRARRAQYPPAKGLHPGLCFRHLAHAE
jgi:hypothetical protein